MTDSKHNNLTIEQLSARREKQGLSVAEVANRIKVSREIINYIEQGEFNRIGSPTFIRGHVGNYAKEIGLDSRTVLDLVPEQHLKPFDLKLSASKVSNPLSRVKTHSSGFGRYVLGTFLVAALGLSFYFVYDKWDNSQQNNVIQTVQTDSSLPRIDAVKQKKVIYSSLLPQADMDNNTATQTVNSELNNTVDETDVLSDDLDGDEPATLPEVESVSNSDELVSDLDSAPVDETMATSAIDSEDALYTIRFDLSEQAWVSVKTQSGANVVSDLIGPGERQFTANEAIHLRIGNADQLVLYINDKVVDLSPNIRQNVADFNWPLQDN